MQNCKTICHASALLAFAALMAACSKPARISAEIKGAPASEIVLFQQNVNRYDILDTVKTDDSGRFTYKLDIEKNTTTYNGNVLDSSQNISSQSRQFSNSVIDDAEEAADYYDETGGVYYILLCTK